MLLNRPVGFLHLFNTPDYTNYLFQPLSMLIRAREMYPTMQLVYRLTPMLFSFPWGNEQSKVSFVKTGISICETKQCLIVSAVIQWGPHDDGVWFGHHIISRLFILAFSKCVGHIVKLHGNCQVIFYDWHKRTGWLKVLTDLLWNTRWLIKNNNMNF